MTTTTEMKPRNSTKHTLLRAADHIEKYGLNQDGKYFAPGMTGKPREECSACVYGALAVASGSGIFAYLDDEGGMEDPYNVNALDEPIRSAADVLEEYLTSQGLGEDGIIEWNDDTENTTPESVVRALRNAAATVVEEPEQLELPG